MGGDCARRLQSEGPELDPGALPGGVIFSISVNSRKPQPQPIRAEYCC